MKTTFVKTGICAMIAATMLVSCQKGELTPTKLSEQLSMGVKVDSAVTYLAVNNTGVTVVNNSTASAANICITSAIANINGFRFEAKRAGLQIKLKSNNQPGVDLFSTLPTLTSIFLDTGRYSDINLKVEFSKSTTGTNLPLVIKGNFNTSAGTVIPLEFDLNDNLMITVSATALVADGKGTLVNIITLHLNKLLTGINETDALAATQTNGAIIISNTSNSAIYSKILYNLTSSVNSNGFQHSDK